MAFWASPNGGNRAVSAIRSPLASRAETSAEQRAATIQFGIQVQEPSDWLTVGIPVRALCSLWSVDNSWSAANQPWLPSLCHVLAGIADHIYQRAGMRWDLGGVMGEEASGCWRHPTPSRLQKAHQGYPPLAVMTAEVIEKRGGFVLPPELWKQLKPTVDPTVLSSGLLYAPPTPNATLTGA